VDIRAVSEADWAALRRVRLRALEDAPDAFASTLAETRERAEAWWRSGATPTPSACRFLAYEGDKPRGIVGVAPDDDDPNCAQLISMWVDPAARRSGLGRALVDTVIDWCRSGGIAELRLWVTESNVAAASLYRACGFRSTGRRQPLRSNPSLDEIEMSLVLTES
jgi:ribosomal protein S18 acetylase RimI-like enzyme